ncbi:ABC-2 transporter permease [candidate division KSB1 bacterium]|nr:ABC-2 transporter permease [candidate division KSB1 bacterium]MBL7094848.1 ABC-2 transporter permease [candidate division KSB1 bacterium]
MGKILKAEFAYNIMAILLAYTIILISFFVALNGSMENIHGLLTVAFIAFFISIGIMGSESDKEKRDRFLTSLPIPLKKYSIARLLFVIFYQLGIFSIIILFYLVKVTTENVSTLWEIVIMNCFSLIFISLFIIFSDLKFYRSKYYRYFFLFVVLIIAALLITGMAYHVIPPVLELGQNFPKTFLDATIFNIIFLAMYYICFIVYNKRNSFLG